MTYEDLYPHKGHPLEVTEFAIGKHLSIECLTCDVILIDCPKEDDRARERSTLPSPTHPPSPALADSIWPSMKLV